MHRPNRHFALKNEKDYPMYSQIHDYLIIQTFILVIIFLIECVFTEKNIAQPYSSFISA